jgi:hypothetical protein
MFGRDPLAVSLLRGMPQGGPCTSVASGDQGAVCPSSQLTFTNANDNITVTGFTGAPGTSTLTNLTLVISGRRFQLPLRLSRADAVRRPVIEMPAPVHLGVGFLRCENHSATWGTVNP